MKKKKNQWIGDSLFYILSRQDPSTVKMHPESIQYACKWIKHHKV